VLTRITLKIFCEGASENSREREREREREEEKSFANIAETVT